MCRVSGARSYGTLTDRRRDTFCTCAAEILLSKLTDASQKITNTPLKTNCLPVHEAATGHSFTTLSEKANTCHDSSAQLNQTSSFKGYPFNRDQSLNTITINPVTNNESKSRQSSNLPHYHQVSKKVCFLFDCNHCRVFFRQKPSSKHLEYP